MSSLTAFAGSVPANYDRYLGPLLFEPYALDLIDRLKSDPLKKVLELACGTGKVTRLLISLLPEDARLIASDLNPDMLALAQMLVLDSNIQWRVVDAHTLPFDKESFDHVVCQFGVMFFSDKPVAFREIYRVLQPSGKFLFNVWDELPYNPRVSVIKKVMDEMFGEQAPDFLKKGAYSFFDKNEIRRLLAHTGFRNIRIDRVEKQTVYSDPDDLVTGFVDGSPLSKFKRDQPASVIQEVRSRMRAELIIQAEQYGSTVPLTALVVEAVK
jgi:ubiquinone/menaquinone biosynthesis C-methylase UbiE